MPVTLDDVARELYGLTPEEFTEARNGRAKELAATGDRALAGEVRRLPKPTAAAWLVNALVRARGREVDELIALGPELRDAQRGGARHDMRRLVDRRRHAIRELVGVASELAAGAGRPMGPQVQRQVEETLEAAVADEESAAAVRAGTLGNPLAFIGFGGDGASDERRGAEVPGATSQSAEKGKAPRRAKAQKATAAKKSQGAEKRQGAKKRETSGDTARRSASDARRRAAERAVGRRGAVPVQSTARHGRGRCVGGGGPATPRRGDGAPTRRGEGAP